MKNKSLILLLLFVFPFFLEGHLQTESKVEMRKDKKLLIGFPIQINRSKDEIFLIVEIPEGYRSIQPCSVWSKGDLIEFIPQNESLDHYTSIITLHKLFGMKIFAPKFLELGKELLVQSNLDNVKVLQFTSSVEPSYAVATLIASYDSQGTHEVLGARYFSSSIDCVGAQCTIRVPKTESEQESIAKIHRFLDHSLKIHFPNVEK